ncbi:hypothetical protein ACR0YU_000795 [Enterococcus faecium]|nr:hypothetical protein [Enterococcus faecium]
MKKLLYILLFSTFAIVALLLLFEHLKRVNLDGTLLEEQIAILNTPKLLIVFFFMCMLSALIFMFYISIFWVYKEIKNKEFTDKDMIFMGFLVKILFIFSIVITLLFCLNETQFSVATTLISFIAIFSFIFSDNQKKSINGFLQKIKKKINGEP